MIVLLLDTCSALQPGAKLPRLQPLVELRGGASPVASLGAAYSAALASAPIITKSATAGTIFAFSDVVAQKIENLPQDKTRILTSALVGLLYFGPALHYWLQMISRFIPGFAVKDTLMKTLLGQAFFGPTITMVFFAASLVSTLGVGDGLRKLPSKIKQDLFVTWTSGLCYWPFVDLIAYGFIPVSWIPLAYNVASFFWTIFLSLTAARKVGDKGKGSQ